MSVAYAVPNESVDLRVVTEIRGAPARLWDDGQGEIVIAGAAGTGKTRQILEWIHRRCSTETIRVLFLRKRLEDLKASALVTFQEQVLLGFDGRRSEIDGVTYFGGNRLKPAQFIYDDTRSVIILGGMDRASKVLSTEYDLVYINEVVELTLDEWESITGRTDRPNLLRPRKPSLVLGECNPGPPSHWIKMRESEGRLKLWASVHEDNPAMWDRQRQEWTAQGLAYIARLEALTGVRYQRLRLGQWAAAEGLVYDGWDRAVHLIDRPSIPREWPRVWVLDFGYEHPFVWQSWAIDDKRRAYLHREIYMTGRLVQDHARQIMEVTRLDPLPIAVISDHDAEGRATFEKETGIRTKAAEKSVLDGLNAVAARLRVQDDGLPRLFICRDALVERDKSLANAGKPTCTAEEFESYEWDTSAGRRKGEQPRKEDDHGMDSTRYLVAHLDPWKKPAVIRGRR